MKDNQHRIEKARETLHEALQDIEMALSEWNELTWTFTSRKQLLSLKISMQAMLQSLEDNVTIQTPGVARVIVDTWPYTNELGLKIIDAENKYKRFKEKNSD